MTDDLENLIDEGQMSGQTINEYRAMIRGWKRKIKTYTALIREEKENLKRIDAAYRNLTK